MKKSKRGEKKKKKRSDKTHVKIPLSSLNTAKNPQKQGRILEGGGEEFFWLARIYTPGSEDVLRIFKLFKVYAAAQGGGYYPSW